MKTLSLIFLNIFLSLALLSANPLWMRYPAISPDAKEIAFSYKGDIYKVSAAGGVAQQLTMHSAYDFTPIWSPDGKNIAFASDRFGNFDIFIVSSNGGIPMRMTTNSANETPFSFTPDGKFLLFGASIQDPASNRIFPTGSMGELYKVPVTGGRVEQVLAIPAEKIFFTKDGAKFLFQDKKGGENKFRKHHKSSVTRDIWICDLKTQAYKQLISDPGEDTDPVFNKAENKVYYLSERGGNLNICSFELNDPTKREQITSFKTNPVRSLTISNNETLCFGYDGEIYTKAPDGKPSKVNIQIIEEPKNNNELFIAGARDVNAVTISKDGKQVAATMRGNIFVSSTEYDYTKQITDTPAKEAMVDFSPDGKTLIYSSLREGYWNIYTAKTTRPEEPYFFNATLINEEPLFKNDKIERTDPVYSPDGKEVAFMEDRTKLKVINLETKKVREVLTGFRDNTSSESPSFEWSPDGKWFVVSYCPNMHDPYADVCVISASGGAVTNLTGSGYASGNPKWVMGGNAIIFSTERFGMRNHASWGSMNDVMIAFVNKEAYDNFLLSKDDAAILKDAEKADKDKDKDKTKDKEKVKDIVMELKGIDNRVVRLTPTSSDLGDAVLAPEGDKLYYMISFDKGYDLWSVDCRTKETKLEIKLDGAYAPIVLDKDGKNLFVLGRGMKKITLAGGKITPFGVKPEMILDYAAEREFMFNDVWLQEQKRFYTKDMHGVDWNLMKKNYGKYLPYINNNYDFAEMLSEMLGELNVSHTGGSYRASYAGADATASLGLIYSWTFGKDGLLVDEVLEDSPFDNTKSKMGSGCIIEKIDGVQIKANEDYYPLLNKKAGKNTLITIYNPNSKERWDEVVKPISPSAENGLLYNRWVKKNAEDVERLSNGRLGYVHIPSMGDPSFRSIYSDILGKYNTKEAIVIDIRNNGGGRLHEDVEILFSGKKYFTQVVRGVETCDMPSRRWNKPSIMITNEADYSNAHGTPWVYQNMGIGKLVGMPVPGTMTSVSWVTLQDPTLVYGIPIVGYRLADGSYLENQQLEPDFKIANSFDKVVKGEDQQLAKAVEELLKQLDSKK